MAISADLFLCSFSRRAKNQRDKLPEETENDIVSAARGTFDSRASLSRRDELCIFEYHGTKLALESTPSTMFARERLLRAARHPHGPRRSASGHGGKSLDGVSCRVAPSRDQRQHDGLAATETYGVEA